MSKLIKTDYSCGQAAILIEKKQTGMLTFLEMLELRIHLAGCSSCRSSVHQNVLIHGMIQEIFHESNFKELVLDEDFRRDLQEHLELDVFKQ